MYAGPHATEANEMLVDLVYIMGKEVFCGLISYACLSWITKSM